MLSIVVVNMYSLDLWDSFFHGCRLWGMQIIISLLCVRKSKPPTTRARPLIDVTSCCIPVLSDNIVAISYLSKEDYSDSLAQKSAGVALPPAFA